MDSKFLTIQERVSHVTSILETDKLASLIEPGQSDEKQLLKHRDHDCKQNKKCTDSTCVLGKKMVSLTSYLRDANADIKYVKKGTSGHTLRCIFKDGKSLAMKVVAYSKHESYGDIYDIRRPENAEIAMIKQLGWFVTSGQTCHIMLPIGTFNIKLEKFIKIAKKKIVNEDKERIKKFDEFVKEYNNKQYYPTASVLVAEWANSGDLYEYLKQNYHNMTVTHWKSLFFQVISVLAVIQEVFPTFRHNDLKPNNILVNTYKCDKKIAIISYNIKGQDYILPNVGFTIRLWDFDFACIPNVVDNAKVYSEWANNINIKPEKNRYYDMHYFLNTLSNKSFFPEIFESKKVPDEVREFVRRIVPEKYAKGKNVVNKGRLQVDDEYILPIDVLNKDPFFQEFRWTEEEVRKINKRVKKKSK